MGMFESPFNFSRWEEAKSEIQPETDRDSPTMMVTISVIKQFTTYLVATYKRINPEYHYDSSQKPVRCLTQPSEPALNDGFDNIENEYILNVNDLLVSPEHREYLILDFLGKGTFGQVVKCRKLGGELCAAKVIKNKPAYFFQGLIEVKILDKLNRELDPEDESHIVRMLDFFVYRNHLIIIFELLSYTVFDLLKENRFRGFSIPLIRILTQQVLKGLKLLSHGDIIHCDLKPENILLKSNNANIKLIDFGSACFQNATIYTYIQSRYYRAPEVLLGLPYGSEIDTWSLGCICAELYIGIPIFPGNSDYDQLARIIELLGPPSQKMIEASKYRDKFFVLDGKEFRFKTREEFEINEKVKLPESKKWIDIEKISDLVMLYPLKKASDEEQKKGEKYAELDKREAFADFLAGLLKLDPNERWSPEQADIHPFIQSTSLIGHFVPPEKQIKERSIPTGALRQGSCPSLLESIRGSSGSSSSSTAEICYRPQVNALPDDFFKGFVHGKLADFTSNQRKPPQQPAQMVVPPNPFMNMPLPPLGMMYNEYINPEPYGPESFMVPFPMQMIWRPPPDIRGPRHANMRPHSYGHASQYKDYHSKHKQELPRPQSPKIDDEKQQITSSARKKMLKHSKKQNKLATPRDESKPRSSSFNQEPEIKPRVGKHNKASSGELGYKEARRKHSSPTTESRFLPSGPIEPDFIPPLTLSTPRQKTSHAGAKSEGGFLDKIAKEARNNSKYP